MFQKKSARFPKENRNGGEKMEWFVLNEISSKDLGVHLLDSPVFSLPKYKTQSKTNNNMHGSIILTGGFQDYDMTLKIGYNRNKVEEDEIVQWLYSAYSSSRLSFSSDLEKYRNVILLNGVEFVQESRHLKTATLTFRCQPFLKLWSQKNFDSTEDPNYATIGHFKQSKFLNIGNYPSEPVITIKSEKDINDLWIDGRYICELNFTGLEDKTLMLNTEKRECTLSDGSLANRRIKGAFPVFPVGVVNLEFTEFISSLKINFNSRWVI